MNITVIGAGIAGLTFAAAMRRFAPAAKVELYERDLSATSRFQGYSLGLKGDGGLEVLKTLGLHDRLATHAVTIGNFMFCGQRRPGLTRTAPHRRREAPDTAPQTPEPQDGLARSHRRHSDPFGYAHKRLSPD